MKEVWRLGCREVRRLGCFEVRSDEGCVLVMSTKETSICWEAWMSGGPRPTGHLDEIGKFAGGRLTYFSSIGATDVLAMGFNPSIIDD